MRMWMLDPKLMCRKHLLGEHVEMHMFAGSLLKGISMDGYVENKLIHAREMINRHDELVVEMKARGYNHNSPMQDVEHLLFDHDVLPDIEWNLVDLAHRCPDCAKRIKDAGIVLSTKYAV